MSWIKRIPKEDLTKKDRNQNTLLFAVCTNSTVTKEMIQCLIDRGSDVNTTCDYGDNFLLNLCYNKNLTVDLLEYALSLGFKVTDSNCIGYTPLYIVSQIDGSHFNELFHYLLLKGADINAKNIHDQTPLDIYCDRHPITQTTLELFINAGAVLNERTVNTIGSNSALNEKFLFYCIKQNKSLFGKKSDVLSYICMYNPTIINDRLVEILLEQGLDIDRKHLLFTPLRHLCNNPKSTKEQIQCLIRHGADFGKEANHQYTAYHTLKYHRGQEFADSI